MNRCLETRRHDGYVYRRYLMADGTTRTTYEVGAPDVNLRDIKGLIRKARAGKKNLRPNVRKIADPDKIDAILEALDAGQTYKEITARLRVSSRTVYSAKYGVRRS